MFQHIRTSGRAAASARRRAATLALGFALVVPVPGWAGAAAAAPAVRIPAPAFLRSVHPLAAWPAAAPVTATIVLAPRHPSALAATALARSTPGSSRYRRWLAPGRVWRQYGPTPRAIATVSARLRQQGFLVHVGRDAWTLSATAPTAVWENVFDMRLARYAWYGRVFRGRATPAAVPPSLAGLVTGITGLTNFAPWSGVPGPSQVGHPYRLATAQPSPAAASAGSTMTESSGGLTVTLSIPGALSKTTGLPMHWVFQSSLDGTPDTSGGISTRQGVGASNTNWGYGALNHLTGGYTVMRLQADTPLTTSIEVTVYSALQSDGDPVAGAPSVTFSIPDAAWTGAATVQALSAQQVDGLYGASGLIGHAPAPPSIGLVEAEPESSSMASALSAFATADGVAAPTVSTVTVTTGSPPSAGWGVEENLDLQAAAAAAPGAAITVYSNPQFDLGTLLQMVAASPRVTTLSMSFGGSGSDQSLVPLIQAVNAEGVTVIASAGDYGSLGSPITTNPPPVGPPSVSHPANLPGVTAVGGTTVAVAAGTSRASATVAWGGTYLSLLPAQAQAEALTARVATGGGYSTTEPAPSWQLPFLAGQTGRGVPDIALLANPNVSGLAFIGRSGQAEVGGGTSQGAPLLAGWVSDIAAQQGHGLGNLNPLLYGLAAASPASFTQAPSGANGAYAIGPADGQPGTWNPVTGLGSPMMAAVASAAATGLPASASLTLPSGAVFGTAATVSATSLRVPNPTYQFWVQEPQNGVWLSSGRFSSSVSYTFDPPVPGTYPVVVFVRPAGSTNTVATARGTFSVTTSSPMVSGLSVSSSATGGVEPPGATVTFTAQAADPNGIAVYQFWVRGPSGTWQVQQNYSTRDTFALANLQSGSYAVSAYALDQTQENLSAWSQAYNYATVVNVGSTLALSAPSGGTAGAPMALTAQATFITDPVYQFWVESPSGTWSQSGPYSTARSFTFTPSAAGTYRVVAYAKDPYAPSTAAFAIVAQATVAVGG